MLVVMGIIGILVAMLFPVVKKAIEAAERTEAQRMVAALDNAIRSYNTEYGRFPLQNASTAQYEYKTNDTARGYVKLISTLRGLDATENPKGIPFLDVPEKQLLDSGPMAGALIDPWDAPFRVWVDWDNDNIINTGASSPYGEIRGRQVVVWSPGPDRIDGTTSTSDSNRIDNATSWGS
jgi:type II secretory pathway pseudopilin PulG